MNDILSILYVADQDRSRQFYTAVLGYGPVLDVPGMTEFILTDTCRLGLMPEQGIARILGDAVPHPASGNGIPRCEIYLRVSDPEVLYQRALAAGGNRISPLQMRDWGERAGYIADPDGHILAFAEKL